MQTTTNLKLFKILTFLVQKVHSHLVLGTLVLSPPNTMLVIRTYTYLPWTFYVKLTFT
jgi:hypothetical protein